MNVKNGYEIVNAAGHRPGTLKHVTGAVCQQHRETYSFGLSARPMDDPAWGRFLDWIRSGHLSCLLDLAEEYHNG